MLVVVTKNKKEKVGNKWQQANCTIHDTPKYPWECREAVLGLSFCPLGTAIWKHLKDENPEDEFPEVVEKAIRFYYRRKEVA